jgi:hypothetical protein
MNPVLGYRNVVRTTWRVMLPAGAKFLAERGQTKGNPWFSSLGIGRGAATSPREEVSALYRLI